MLYEIPLQPGANPATLPARHFKLVESPNALRVKVGDEPEMKLVAGQHLSAFQGELFERLVIWNPLPTVLRVKYWWGRIMFGDDRANQYEAPTVFRAVSENADFAAGVLGANGEVDLDGAPAFGLLRRKAVQVANLDPAVNLELRDGDDNVGLIVRPGETLTQPVSGPIRIANPSAAPVACRISEIWWTP
jgi:hypothetical protein